MDTQAKLDALEKEKQAKMKTTPTEHQTAELDKLSTQVELAKSAAANSPDDVTNAEELYYKALDGPDGYTDHLKTIYTAESEQVRIRMLARHEELLKTVDASIASYNTVNTYQTNVSSLQDTKQKSIDGKLDKIRTSKIDTNNRKFYYLDGAQYYQRLWLIICNCFIISYALLYSLTNWTNQQKILKTYGIIIISATVVFILPTVISFITHIPLSINAFTDLGYDPIESKTTWVFIIPFGIIALYYAVIYADSFYK